MKAFYRPEEVAKKMGMNSQYIRIHMEDGSLPIGIVTRGGGNMRADYKIFPKMLYDVTGYRIDGFEPPIVVVRENESKML